MDIEFDGGYVLYALGVLLGIFSVFYFGFEILLGLSPVTKALLLLAVTSCFLLAGARFYRRFLSIPFYLLGAFSYVVFIVYTLARFGFSREVDFLLLAVSSAAFLGLGYLLRNSGTRLGTKRFRAAISGILLAAIVLSAVDAAGPQPEYSLELKDEVRISSDETVFGTLQVENSFFLYRGTDIPRYEACTSGRESLFVDMKEPGLMPGHSSTTVNLTVQVPRASDGGFALEGVYSIEKAESCPENPAEDTIYVFEEERRYD
ncbi:MAG: hypothetical protein ABEJ07_00505 [Candidatus Nanohaloarchaea archaeon]